MKLRTIFVGVLAALTLSACSKDEKIGTGDGELSSVSIKLTEGVATRAAAETGEIINTTEDIVFNDGYMFFVQGQIITKRVQIVNTAGPVTSPNGDGDEVVKYDDLKSGISFAVPQSSDKVVFVGNTPAGVTIPPALSNVNNFLNTIVDVKTQADAKGGVDVVSIYGDGNIVAVTGQSHDAEANVTISPITARLQVITLRIDEQESDYATPASGDQVISNFKVKGLFVNYFLPNANLKGEAVTADLITYSALSKWTPETSTNTLFEAYYSLNYLGVLYDYSESAGIGKMTPSTGGYDAVYDANTGYDGWAYNIFETQVPHLIVKVSDVTYKEYDGSAWQDLTVSGDRYITIKGFLEGTTPVTSFDRSYVYTIDEIPVKYSYLTESPEEEDTKDIFVNITVKKWVEKKVKPVLP